MVAATVGVVTLIPSGGGVGVLTGTGSGLVGVMGETYVGDPSRGGGSVIDPAIGSVLSTGEGVKVSN